MPQQKYVYMIRAGEVAKIGCSSNPIGRFKALRPFLSIYGEPILVGYVPGTHEDEKRAYRLGQPYPGAVTREIRLGSSLPDIQNIFPDREFKVSEPVPVLADPEVIAKKPRKMQARGDTFQLVQFLLSEDVTRPYASIALEIGITRERVRQIAKAIGETAKDRSALRKDIEFHSRTTFPGFQRIVRKWLIDAGYDYCPCAGHEGGRVLDYSIQQARRCRPCNAAHVRAFHHTDKGRQYYEQYNESERGKEVQRKAQAKYYAKRKVMDPETRKMYSAKYYAIKVGTPEGRERKRAYERERYRIRRARGLKR